MVRLVRRSDTDGERGAPIDLVLFTKREARRLIERLRLDGASRMASFNAPAYGSWTTTLLLTIIGVGVIGVLALPPAVAWPTAAGLTLVTALVAWLSRRERSIAIGADGVLCQVGKASEFVGYDEVTRVQARHDELELELRSGKSIRLPTVRADAPDNVASSSVLAERVREAKAAWRKRVTDRKLDAALSGVGQRPAEWARSLRALASEARIDHRTAPLRADALWPIVEDAAQGARARAGAAAVLSLSGAVERERLRRIADATAEPRLRIVLERAADLADGEVLEEALADLEDDDARAKTAHLSQSLVRADAPGKKAW